MYIYIVRREPKQLTILARWKWIDLISIPPSWFAKPWTHTLFNIRSITFCCFFFFMFLLAALNKFHAQSYPAILRSLCMQNKENNNMDVFLLLFISQILGYNLYGCLLSIVRPSNRLNRSLTLYANHVPKRRITRIYIYIYVWSSGEVLVQNYYQ